MVFHVFQIFQIFEKERGEGVQEDHRTFLFQKSEKSEKSENPRQEHNFSQGGQIVLDSKGFELSRADSLGI